MLKKKRDNTTFKLKLNLRKQALLELDEPVVMETHGGWGKLYGHLYSEFPGVVFEKDSDKAEFLARQRPTWAVYETNCQRALRDGVGAHLDVNFLDLDPYGEPWPVLSAFLNSKRPLPPKLVVCVNDGLRKSLHMGGGWHVKSLSEICNRYGNAWLLHNYIEVCKEMLRQRGERVGYDLARWTAYYCGHKDTMTHYAAVLIKAGSGTSARAGADRQALPSMVH
jgi:hypothetical protein